MFVQTVQPKRCHLCAGCLVTRGTSRFASKKFKLVKNCLQRWCTWCEIWKMRLWWFMSLHGCWQMWRSYWVWGSVSRSGLPPWTSCVDSTKAATVINCMSARRCTRWPPCALERFLTLKLWLRADCLTELQTTFSRNFTSRMMSYGLSSS